MGSMAISDLTRVAHDDGLDMKLATSFIATGALHAASPLVMMRTPSKLTQMAFLLFLFCCSHFIHGR